MDGKSSCSLRDEQDSARKEEVERYTVANALQGKAFGTYPSVYIENDISSCRGSAYLYVHEYVMSLHPGVLGSAISRLT